MAYNAKKKNTHWNILVNIKEVRFRVKPEENEIYANIIILRERWKVCPPLCLSNFLF